MTQEEYKTLQEKYYVATEILNQIDNAKRELKLYVSHKADILNPSQIHNLKASLPEDEVDKLIDEMRNKIINKLNANIINLEKRFEEL